MNAITRLSFGPLMSAEQFWAWPGDGTDRAYQLIDGELAPMAPTSCVHGFLQAKLAALLFNHLQAHRPRCHALITPGVEPHAGRGSNVRIPDIVVDCGPLQPKGPASTPVVIIELLSPSNARETREAVRACLTIPSLREAVILGTETRGAELYRRDTAGHWPANPEDIGPDDDLILDSIGFRLPLAELYAGSGLG